MLLFSFTVGSTVLAQTGWSYVAQEASKENLWSIAFGNETYVAVGERGTILSRAPGDASWRSEESGVAVWLVGAGYGNGRFVVVGDQGAILTSDDNGLTWTPRLSGTTQRLNAAVFGNGRWLAVGEQGTVLVSIDGTSWSPRPALGSGFLRGLAFGQGQFLIGGARGALFTTVDGTTFSPITIATVSDIESIAISPSRVWLVGSNGLWASGTQAGTLSIAPSVTATTFRGVAPRQPEEAVTVGDVGSAVFRNGTWAADANPQPFLGTAVATGSNEILAVGFGAGIARAEQNPSAIAIGRYGAAEYGSTITLSGGDTGNQPATYQWTTGSGEVIPGATGKELTIINITPAKAAYRLYASASAVGGYNYTGISIPVYPAGQIEVRDPRFTSALPVVPNVAFAQPDGKLLVAGPFSLQLPAGATHGLARLNVDGSLDQSFRAGSGIGFPESVQNIQTLSDGRIYIRGNFSSVGGVSRRGLARLLQDGTVDPTFNPPIFAELPENSAPTGDGRIYVQIGRQSYLDARAQFSGKIYCLRSDGSLDPSFVPREKSRLIAVDDQNRLLVAEPYLSDERLARYLPNGAVDPSYTPTPLQANGPAPFSWDNFVTSILTSSGLYTVRMERPTRLALAANYSFRHYHPDGGLDANYHPRPTVATTNVPSFGYRKDGGLWVVSRDNGERFSAISVAPTGEVDATRYATQRDENDLQILAIAPDDSLIGVGYRYTLPYTPRLIRVRPITGPPGKLTNLSARATLVEPNDPLIVGFVTSGTGTTTALVRAIGPSLTPFGVADAVENPNLTFFSNSNVVGLNDDWSTSLAARFVSVGAFALPVGSKDAALESIISVGSYSAVARAQSTTQGTGLVELFHSADPQSATRNFINVSARAAIDETHPLIAGFVITGDVPMKVLIRAAGPSLSSAPFNLNGTLSNPMLTLYRGAGALWDNDNWDTGRNVIAQTAVSVGAFPFATSANDSAMVVALSPGSYSAVVSGVNNARGMALVEVYAVP